MDVAAFLVAAYGAALSTILAVRSWRQDHRRVRIMSSPLVSTTAEDHAVIFLYEVRALNEGHRPVHLRQAGTILDDGTVYLPLLVPPRWGQQTTPAVLDDGGYASCFFDVRSLDPDRYLPRVVYMEDYGEKRYVKRLTDSERDQLRDFVVEAHERLEPLD